MSTTSRRHRTGWLLGAALCCVLGGASVARADSDTADLLQKSYDTEATGRLQDSLAAMDRIGAPQRDSFVVQLRRAWLLYRLGRHGDSIEAYNQAIAQSPKAVESRLGILLPQLALRRWADAETSARAALRLDPNSYLATLRLAFTLYNLHRYDESAAQYKKLNELYPSDVEVLSGLGWALLKQGRQSDAAARFREILEIAPRHALAKEGLKAAGG